MIGEVLYLDQFGNAITNLEARAVDAEPWRQAKVFVRGRSMGPLRQFYQQVKPGEPLALIGSCGLVEISVNQGSAAEKLRLTVGDPVELRQA